MAVRLVAAVIAAGGTLTADGDRLVCRLPAEQQLPAALAEEVRTRKTEILAALTVASLAETIQSVAALSAAERVAWERALAHDLAAWATANSAVNGARR